MGSTKGWCHWKKGEIPELNSYLDAIEGSIFSIQKEYTLRDQMISAEDVRCRVLKKVKTQNKKLIEIYLRLWNFPYNPATINSLNNEIGNIQL